MNLLFTIILVIGEAYRDYELLKTKYRFKSHVSRAIMRTVMCIIIGYPDPAQMFASWIFFAATFDNTLNLMRGKELFYLGKTAKWDIFWRDRMPLYIFFIIVALFVSITIMLLPLLNH